LFKATRNWSDIRPDPSHKNGPPVEWFLIEEFAASILEPAGHGLIYSTVIAGGPIVTPLMSFGIVETKGQTFDVTGRAICLELLKISATAPDLSNDRGAFVLDPCGRASQRVKATRQMSFPSTNGEIIIMLPIGLGEGLSGWLRRGWNLLGEHLLWQWNSKAAHQQKESTPPELVDHCFFIPLSHALFTGWLKVITVLELTLVIMAVLEICGGNP
jgi:hypothetical protein